MNHIIRLTTGSLFIIFGIYVMFMDMMPGNIDPKFKKMLGVVLICYGTFRIVHTHFRKNLRDNSDSEEQQNVEK